MRKLACLALALMLAACPPAFASREENSVAYDLSAVPERLCTIKANDAESFQLIRHLYAGLLELDENDMPAPGVAKEYTVSEDGLVYTFKLRDGAKWWDGVPVTAHDFYYAWTELLKSENACGYAQMAFCVKNAQAYYQGRVQKEELGLRVVDELTFEVTLEYPAAYFPYLAAFGAFMPQRQDFVERCGEAYGTDAGKIMGNGAYKIAEWRPDHSITLVKNDEYFDKDSVALERLVGRVCEDKSAAYAMFEAGELDMVSLTAVTGLLAEQDGHEALQYSNGSTCFLEMNCAQGPTANLNIRKALGLSINRQSLINNVLRDYSKPALTFTNGDIRDNEGKPFSENISVAYQDADIESAKAHWSQGLEELGMTAFEAAQAITLLAGDGGLAKEEAAVLQKYWKAALGVEIEVEYLSAESQAQRVEDGEYGLALSEWKADFPDPAAFLEPMLSECNDTGWHNAQYDELVKGAAAQTDLDRRMDMLAGAENILLSEMPVAPLYFPMSGYALADGLEGVRRSAFQGCCFQWAGWAE